MLKIATKSILAALVFASAVAAIPATASADSFSFGFGIGDGDGGMRHHRHRHWDNGDGFFPGVPGFPGDDEGGYRPHRPRGGCSQWEAIDTARSYGLRDPQIVDFGRRVVVEGRRHHNYVRLVMINAPGCPVAGY